MARSARATAANVNEYLAGVDARFRPLLRDVRATVKKAAPEADESITYGIPTYKYRGKRLAYFSAATAHCAVHMITPDVLDDARRLGFKIGRGSIQFTPEHPLPARLLARVVKTRMKEIDRGERGI